MYSAINVAGFVLLFLGTAIYIIYLMFFCCCGDKIALPKAKCCTPDQRFHCAYGFMGVTLVLMLVIGVLGQALGGSVLFEAVTETADAPKGAANLVHSQVAPVENLFINSMSDVVVPFVSGLNKTVFETISLEHLCDEVDTVRSVIVGLPHVNSLRQTLNEINGSKAELSNRIGDIAHEIDLLDGKKIDILKNASGLRAKLVTCERIINESVVILSDAQPIVEEFQNISSRIVGPPGRGIAGSCADDLTTIRRSNTAGQGFPPTANFTSASTGSFASMSRLILQSMNSAPAEIQSLVDKLKGIYGVRLLPNYTTTALRIIEINSTINTLLSPTGLIAAMDDKLAIIDAELKSIPSGPTIRRQVRGFLDLAGNFSLSGAWDRIDAVTSLLSLVEGHLRGISTDVMLVARVKELIPVFHDLLITQKERINENLYNISFDTAKTFRTVNDTISKAVQKINEINGTLASGIDSLRNVNTTSYYETIDKTQQSIKDRLSAVDQTSIFSIIDSFEQKSNSVNVTKYRHQLSSLRALLKSSLISMDIVNSLYAFDDLKDSLIESLRRVVDDHTSGGTTRKGDYVVLAGGFCSSKHNVDCSTDSDCFSVSGGTCTNIGRYRCTSNGSPTDAITLDCTSDSSCGSGTFCLTDSTRANTLLNILSAYTVSFDTSKYRHTINVLNNLDSSSYMNVSSLSHDLSSAKSSFQDASLGPYITQLDDLKSEVNSYDLASVKSTVETAKKDVNSADLRSFNDSLDHVKEIQDKIDSRMDDAVDVCTALKRFFYGADYLRSHLEFFSKSNMLQLRESLGPAGLIRTSFERMDDIWAYFRTSLKNITSVPKPSIQKELKAFPEFIARANDKRKMDKYGALYYLLDLANATSEGMVSADDPTADTISEDKNGNAYAGDHRCVTRQCFENTQAAYEDDQAADAPVDTTLKSLVSYIWIPPCIAFFIGVVAMVTPLLSKRNGFRRAPATCMLCCLILQLGPFLLFSGLLFPLAIISSDGCSTGREIPKNYISAYGDDLCTGRYDGEGTLRDCRYSSHDFDVHVDLWGITNGLLGSCSENNPALGDPFGGPLNQLAEQFSEQSKSKVRKQLNKDTKYVKRIRRKLKDLAINSSSNAGGVLSSFLIEESKKSLTCSNIAAISNELLVPVCDYGVGSVSWLLAMFYLISWTMCCLGIPAGCAIQYDCDWREREHAIAEKDELDHHALDLEGDGEELSSTGDQDKPVETGGFGALLKPRGDTAVPTEDPDEEGHENYGGVLTPRDIELNNAVRKHDLNHSDDEEAQV
jgi:hypothetical protein